jgi:N-acyl homoserine lactone hydrolase
MNVELLITGWITTPTALYLPGEDPELKLRFPVPAYVIETEHERILVDTGLHPGAVADTTGYYERPEAGLFELEQDSDIAAQLDLGTITRVVLTHLHFDHAGGLALLPSRVPVVIQAREWAAAHDAAAIARNFLYPRDYDLDDSRLVLIDGDHDLLGDGSVELLLTPGHTPGHQSVRVGEQLVIGADVGHFAATLDDLRFPSFADDFDAQAASARRLRAIRDAGSRVMPGHDPAVLAPGPVALA